MNSRLTSPINHRIRQPGGSSQSTLPDRGCAASGEFLRPVWPCVDDDLEIYPKKMGDDS